MKRDVWYFEGFEFNAARGLTHDGIAVPIQAKPRKLLELLLRASGGIVTKDSIVAALWSDGSPSDASIARAVSALRKALGKGGDDIVTTIYGEGIRLNCIIAAEVDDNPGDRKAVAALLQTAWEIMSDRKPDSHVRAIETLRHALVRFPEAGAAWALKADIYGSMVIRGLLAPREAAAKINHCCQKALQIDPSCAQALAVSGWALGLLSGRSEAGLRRLDSSIHAGSNWPTFLYRAWLQLLRRDLAAAIEDLEKGLAFTPLDRSMLSMRAFVTLYQGKFEEADALARETHRIRNDIDGLWIVRSIVASEMGDFGRSCSYAERAAALMEGDRKTLTYLAYAYAKAGQADRARKTLAGIGPGVNGHTPAFLAAPYLALGEIAEAIRIVEIAKAERCPYRAILWCDPRLKPIWLKI